MLIPLESPHSAGEVFGREMPLTSVGETGGNTMRSYIAAAVLAAGLVLTPVAAGYAPALSQDFSITNPGTGPGSDWIGKLQAWWDVHSYYPPDALEKKQDGTVKLHLVIHPDGEVWTEETVQGSGSKSIDTAGFYVFHGAHLPPFPPGAPAPQAEVNLALHYVLEHRPSKSPFTIGNDPVEGTVVETMMQRTCTGTLVPIWWWTATGREWIQAIFYRNPDGTNWIRIYYNGKGPISLPVTELGKSASWTTPQEIAGKLALKTHYWVWPVGDNRLSGTTVEPYGTVDFTCEWVPTFSGFQADPLR